MKVQILTTPNFVLPAVQTDDMGMPYFELAENIRAELPPHFEACNLSETEWLTIVIGAGLSIPCNLVAAYLYDLLKNKKASKVVVNEITIEGDKETIERILKDVVEQTQG